MNYLDILAASLLQWKLEVNVLRHADLLIKQRGLALIAQLLPPARIKEVLCQSLLKLGYDMPSDTVAEQVHEAS